MNLVADEGIERLIVSRLLEDGHTVFCVAELDPGLDDVTILSQANDKRALLVTSDKDFGELVYRRKLIHYGVLLLRLPGLLDEEKARIVASVLRTHDKELLGSFCVVTAKTIRIRKTL